MNATLDQSGLWVTLMAHAIWGLMPLYWHLLREVPPLQVRAAPGDLVRGAGDERCVDRDPANLFCLWCAPDCSAAGLTQDFSGP